MSANPLDEVKAFTKRARQKRKAGQTPSAHLIKSRAVESLADICYLAGASRYHSGDSREDMDTFIEWANEFERTLTVVDGEQLYNGKEYMEAIEEFALAKISATGHGRKSVSRALSGLIADIEAMQMPLRDDEGDPAFHEAQRDDYFGPFGNYLDQGLHLTQVAHGGGVRVCWPNLRILLTEAKAVL